MNTRKDPASVSWAVFFARWILGLMFFMGALWRIFQLGPVEHARRFLVVPYADTFLPAWSLWFVGTAIPFVELAAGALLLLGFWRRRALLLLGAELTIITFGHLVAEPLYAFHEHVIPRLALLLFLLSMPPSWDKLALDLGIARRRNRSTGPSADTSRSEEGR